MATHPEYHVGGAKTVAASETKSLWLINPVGDAVKLTEIGVSGDGSAAVKGTKIELYRTVTLGSPAGTSDTPRKVSLVGDAAAPSSTCLINLSAEPTSVELIGGPWFVRTDGGLLVIQFPLGREPFAAPAGARLGMRYTTPTGVTDQLAHYAKFEE